MTKEDIDDICYLSFIEAGVIMLDMFEVGIMLTMNDYRWMTNVEHDSMLYTWKYGLRGTL